MLRLAPVVLLASVTACGVLDGGDEIITPLVAPDTVSLHFTRWDDADILDVTFDVQTATLAGFRIEQRGEQLCRHRVAAPVALTNPAALQGALAASQLSQLTGDLCADAQAGCGGIDVFLGVQVNDGDRFSMQPSMCETLLADATLETSLATAFASTEPVLERVEWVDSGYVVRGACTP